MKPGYFRISLLCLVLAAVGTPPGLLAHEDGSPVAGVTPPAYDPASNGTRKLVYGPVWIRMLADASNLGRDDVEVGELFLPAGFGASDAHQHGSLEIFYVLEGVLGHEVNGQMHRLETGMLGFVKPGDAVRHTVMSDGPVHALVIWVPGGEADRLIEHAGFTAEAMD